MLAVNTVTEYKFENLIPLACILVKLPFQNFLQNVWKKNWGGAENVEFYDLWSRLTRLVIPTSNNALQWWLSVEDSLSWSSEVGWISWNCCVKYFERYAPALPCGEFFFFQDVAQHCYADSKTKNLNQTSFLDWLVGTKEWLPLYPHLNWT